MSHIYFVKGARSILLSTVATHNLEISTVLRRVNFDKFMKWDILKKILRKFYKKKKKNIDKKLCYFTREISIIFLILFLIRIIINKLYLLIINK